MKTSLTIISLLFLVSFMTACSGSVIEVQHDTTYEDYSIPQNWNQYLIGPNDLLQATYYFEMTEDENEYQIDVGDIVKIEFYLYPEFNREETVLPDGLIALPPKGKMKIIGLTRTELERKIEGLYGNLISAPVVTVSLSRFDYSVNQLKDAITSNDNGQMRRIRLQPDGYISFPAIDDFQASGMTLQEISNKVNKLYKEKYNQRIQVFLALVEARNNLVYVMGEVGRPNLYQIDQHSTLSQILARSAVLVGTAELSTILVLSRNEQNKPLAKLYDMDEVIRTGNIGKDLSLQQYDVVFVPRTKIKQASQFAQQLGDAIPFFNGAGVGFTYDLERLDL